MTWRLFALASAATVATACSSGDMPADRGGFTCVRDFRAPVTECADAVRTQLLDKPRLSNPGDLVIVGVKAWREGARLAVEVDLRGGFHSEIDQNIYLLIGGSGSPPARFALSADDAYAAEVGYPVRGKIDVPHGLDLRVGVMAPQSTGYSPQVYLKDTRYADAVGDGSGVILRTAGRHLTMSVPLDRYYGVRSQPVPETVAVTVATARDYVGFVHLRTVARVSADGVRSSAEPAATDAASYPALDLDAHELRGMRLEARDNGTDIVFETKAPITDWAQTNLQVFLFPVEPYKAAFTLMDPAKTRELPFKWSYYCGVYSPTRVFCKASSGSDFTFDEGYSDRTALPMPEGVSFRSVGARHILSLTSRTLRAVLAGRPTFAAAVAIGRDGFAPTSWAGLPPR